MRNFLNGLGAAARACGSCLVSGTQKIKKMVDPIMSKLGAAVFGITTGLFVWTLSGVDSTSENWAVSLVSVSALALGESKAFP